jgi:MoxR-like ATPase
MKAIDALYQYDTLTRLNDSRFGDSDRDVSEINEYIRMGKIGMAFTSLKKVVLLIDEIDKADTDFQDDLLDILDLMQFDIIETDETIRARKRPVIIITSNSKKNLSDPFLGRCNFHHIAFPDPKMMRKIINVHFPELDETLAKYAISTFYKLREIDGVEKRPATRELINWVRALKADPDFKSSGLIKDEVPFLGVLFKKSLDYTKADSVHNQNTA